MVRRTIWWLLFVCIMLGVLVWRQHQAICHTPILYRIGHIDAQFGLSDSEVRTALAQAEHLWENALGRNLFEYSAIDVQVCFRNLRSLLEFESALFTVKPKKI